MYLLIYFIKKIDKQKEAKENWKKAINTIKQISSTLNLMKTLSFQKKAPLIEEKPTITIDNVTYNRPILHKYFIEKEQSTFEVYEQYEVKSVLGFGAYGI
jgi:hypothetical protein